MSSKNERKRILYACHVDPTAGYLGKSRTIYRIKERYMWHDIVKDVMEMVGNICMHLHVICCIID